MLWRIIRNYSFIVVALRSKKYKTFDSVIRNTYYYYYIIMFQLYKIAFVTLRQKNLFSGSNDRRASVDQGRVSERSPLGVRNLPQNVFNTNANV